MTIPFTDGELSLLYGKIQLSIKQIKAPDLMSKAELDGAIYTNLRRELSGTILFPLVNRQKKHWQRYPSTQTTYMKGLIEQMKKEQLKKSEDSIAAMKLSLAAMNHAVTELTAINKQADTVIDDVEAIHKILNDGEENVEG